MENNRRRNVEVRPSIVRNDKRVAIYCRVSTLSDIQEESLKARSMVWSKSLNATLSGLCMESMRIKIPEGILFVRDFRR